MKILHVIQLALLAHHVYGMTTIVTPLDPIKGKNINAFEKCVVELDLSSIGLTRVNRSLISDPCLKKLSLQFNSIEGFEDGIFEYLTGLEYLDLSYNKLTKDTLFSFGSIPSLKTLILEGNNRNRDNFTLDTKLYFPELTHLSLAGLNTNSVAINWSEYFPKIEELDISRNPLTLSMNEFSNRMPTTLRSLKMRSVDLTKLKIQNLKNVTSLNLDFNVFRSIKRSSCGEEGLCLENLDGLESLILGNCHIELIEEHAFEHLTKLSYLDLRGNNITRISKGTFGHFPSLSVLDISMNPLIDVSFISELQHLTTLRMNWMRGHSAIYSLFSLSSVPTRIQILYLEGNWMFSIPSEFLDNLQDLRELYLVWNHISSLSPGSWQRNLKVIDLFDNNVSKIEDLHLCEARSLQLLNLELNKLESIDPEVRKTLPENLDLKL